MERTLWTLRSLSDVTRRVPHELQGAVRYEKALCETSRDTQPETDATTSPRVTMTSDMNCFPAARMIIRALKVDQ